MKVTAVSEVCFSDLNRFWRESQFGYCPTQQPMIYECPKCKYRKKVTIPDIVMENIYCEKDHPRTKMKKIKNIGIQEYKDGRI